MLKNISVRQSIFKTLITLAVSASILSGCAPAGLRSVSEENKDTSGTYDGQWVAVGVSTASTQRVGTWRLTCTDQQDKKFGPINVSNGQASLDIGNDEGKGFVDGAGIFRLEVPIEAIARASGTSDSSINNGAVTVILNGSLADQTGFLTFGVAQFGNAGCATSVTYNRV